MNSERVSTAMSGNFHASALSAAEAGSTGTGRSGVEIGMESSKDQARRVQSLPEMT